MKQYEVMVLTGKGILKEIITCDKLTYNDNFYFFYNGEYQNRWKNIVGVYPIERTIVKPYKGEEDSQ